jgi:SAM-dependent methyltransferase
VSTAAVPDRERLLEHLERRYAGVFAPGQVERHVDEYVGMELPRALVAEVQRTAPEARTLLDVGSGFGSFVLAAREAGIDALGIELEPFEVEYARGRLRAAHPENDPAAVYLEGSGLALPFPDASFDVLTSWNVVEHVPDRPKLFAEAARVLRPGGVLIGIAPNYAALRREAHYHVPWPPLVPKGIGTRYLRLLNRDPRFWEDDIHPCSNVTVLRELRAAGLMPGDPRVARLADPAGAGSARSRRLLGVATSLGLLRLLRLGLAMQLWNPLRTTIAIHAVKGHAGSMSSR